MLVGANSLSSLSSIVLLANDGTLVDAHKKRVPVMSWLGLFFYLWAVQVYRYAYARSCISFAVIVALQVETSGEHTRMGIFVRFVPL